MPKPPETLDGYQPRQRESGFFADYHHVRVGVAELREVDGLKPNDPQRWKEMSSGQRIEALQEAEIRLARVQGRPAEKVHGVPMADNEYGYYEPSPSDRGIYVNTNLRLFNDRAESLNTVVHEGRHAYQLHAVENPGFHPERPGFAAHEDVRNWAANESDYKTIGRDGPAAYAAQPVEHDAGAFGVAVTRGLYPDYQPSPDRIDQYNARNAQHKYGGLKTGPESQRVGASDPVNAQQHPAREMANSSAPAQQAPKGVSSECSSNSPGLAQAFGKPAVGKAPKTSQLAESGVKTRPQGGGLHLRQ